MSFTPPSGLRSCLKRPRWPVLKKTTLSDLRFPAKVYPRFRACSFRHGLSVLPTPPEDSEHLKLHFQLLCHRRGDSVTGSHYEQYDKVVIFSGEAPDTLCGGLRLEIQILLDSVIKSRYPMWLCFLYLLQSWPIWSCLREWHTVLCNKSKVSSHQLRGTVFVPSVNNPQHSRLNKYRHPPPSCHFTWEADFDASSLSWHFDLWLLTSLFLLRDFGSGPCIADTFGWANGRQSPVRSF